MRKAAKCKPKSEIGWRSCGRSKFRPDHPPLLEGLFLLCQSNHPLTDPYSCLAVSGQFGSDIAMATVGKGTNAERPIRALEEGTLGSSGGYQLGTATPTSTAPTISDKLRQISKSKIFFSIPVTCVPVPVIFLLAIAGILFGAVGPKEGGMFLSVLAVVSLCSITRGSVEVSSL